jgi:hypothetical protein
MRPSSFNPVLLIAVSDLDPRFPNIGNGIYFLSDHHTGLQSSKFPVKAIFALLVPDTPSKSGSYYINVTLILVGTRIVQPQVYTESCQKPDPPT